MKRENVKDAFELVAAIGVIATLAFVALEIRQNTDVARSVAAAAIADQSYDAVMRLVEDDDLRAAFLKGFNEELSREEAELLRMFYNGVIRIQINRYEQVRLGIIDLELALSLGGRADAYASPFFLNYWDEVKGRYPEGFRQYIEDHVIGVNGT